MRTQVKFSIVAVLVVLAFIVWSQSVPSIQMTVSQESESVSMSALSTVLSLSHKTEVSVHEKSVQDFRSELKALPEELLRNCVSGVDEKIEKSSFVQRANRGQLSATELTELGELMAKRAAAKLILIERDLAELEKKNI